MNITKRYQRLAVPSCVPGSDLEAKDRGQLRTLKVSTKIRLQMAVRDQNHLYSSFLSHILEEKEMISLQK